LYIDPRFQGLDKFKILDSGIFIAKCKGLPVYQYNNQIYPCVTLAFQGSRMCIFVSLSQQHSACVDTFSFDDVGSTAEFVQNFARNKAERIAHDLDVPFYDEVDLNLRLYQVDLFAA
ncbi:hypothetical protein, partial [Neisseria shayeganii]